MNAIISLIYFEPANFETTNSIDIKDVRFFGNSRKLIIDCLMFCFQMGIWVEFAFGRTLFVKIIFTFVHI